MDGSVVPVGRGRDRERADKRRAVRQWRSDTLNQRLRPAGLSIWSRWPSC